MNEGTYPLPVVNEAIDRVRNRVDPKDVADELRLKYGYENLHAKTVARWYRQWPMGKLSKSLPAAFREDVRELVREETSQDVALMAQVSAETIAAAKLAAGAAESGIYGESRYGGASYA